ncbi:NADP-dependent oxidoreductase [Nocardia jejuensis]|uniref:NADP-dependent oxidoreductase n=1 Tax=Nocardia jejuensis TaxID=328049 RepID=UPI000833FEBB|nr:NADP-dependent oxidoreductase [Nocardia jejuensis]
MARTVRPTDYGTPDVLEVADTPVPTPSADGVVVKVRAAGVNPIDWKLYSGQFHAVADKHKNATGLAESLPKLGLECAGVVTAVGADVTGIEVGAEVIVYPVAGAYADYVTAPATSLIPKPADLDWPEAGSLMLAGLTAAHTLHAAGVGRGDTVLVHGAAGGVGLLVTQLAAASGARVIGTAAERNHDLLREFGATPVRYGDGLLERVRTAAPDGITAAIDCVGTDEALDTSLALVPDPQRIASIAGTPRRAAAGIKVLGNGPGQDAGAEFRDSVRADLAARAGKGELRVLIDTTYPLTEAAAAHRAGIAGHAPGKLVLLP